eukprot:TRINITY_DN3022_c0_g1_i1.p1 TRINITY_DN3022_c0_g1~~TRINITY_DN3022_c0_g1_i1.p1  ORF type:complete len:300 (-),score=47.61 TRINITY_DN3022_c0_g1_i1:23-922(-)
MKHCCVFLILVSLVSSEYVPTPVGYMWSDCVHKVDSGSHIIDQGENGVMVVSPNSGVLMYPRCEKPSITKAIKNTLKQNGPSDGWQVWSTFRGPNNNTFDTFLGSFSVPTAPKNWPDSGIGILYMFTGLQNLNWIPNGPPAPPQFNIIQPVLQYGGGSANGGGKYWGVASWYVTVDGTGSFWSEEIEVKPGDKIFGNMTRTGDSTWYIGATVPSGQKTELTATHDRLKSQSWAYTTLEVYDIFDCNSFPDSSTSLDFTGLQLFQGKNPVTPTWVISSGDNQCGAQETVVDPSHIVLKFQ